MLPEDREFLLIALQLRIVVTRHIQLRHIDWQLCCRQLVQNSCHGTSRYRIHIEIMSLNTDAIDQSSIFQKVDNLDILVCFVRIINDAIFVDE
ncbi:hypothetical protein D3C73_1459760 [compost metagenome]